MGKRGYFHGGDPDHPTGFQLKPKAGSGDPEVVYFRNRVICPDPHRLYRPA
ncbi:hypothetical protein [Thermoactinomyces sp. CICC 10521]|uniref:hypothetical protein n=1 Tax=Thermoactinomyces TaxID=2023 RepID=UPI000B2EC886